MHEHRISVGEPTITYSGTIGMADAGLNALFSGVAFAAVGEQARGSIPSAIPGHAKPDSATANFRGRTSPAQRGVRQPIGRANTRARQKRPRQWRSPLVSARPALPYCRAETRVPSSPQTQVPSNRRLHGRGPRG